MTKILVTGGAGYVGSVSAEAFLRAGHEVVVLDDLSTGHRGSRATGRVAPPGHVRRRRLRWPACSSPNGSRRSSIAPRARWSVSRSPTRRGTTATTSPAGSPCSRRRARRRSNAWSSRRRPRSTASPTSRPIPEDAPLRPINPVRRVEADVRRRPGLVRPGLRPAQRDAPLLQRRRRDRGARRRPRPRDPPHPERPAAPPKATRRITVFGDDYPTPDGTCIRDYIHVADLADAHLKAIDATAPGDPRTNDRSSATWGTAAASRSARSSPPPRPSSGARSRRPSGRAAPGDPPVLVARADRAAEVLDWRPARPSLEEIVGSAWAWRLDTPGRLPGLSRARKRPPTLPV